MMSDFARIYIPEKCTEIQTQLRKYTGNSLIQLVNINIEEKLPEKFWRDAPTKGTKEFSNKEKKGGK